MDKVIEKIAQWHKDRNLIEGATSKDQVLKLIQEVGELSSPTTARVQNFCFIGRVSAWSTSISPCRNCGTSDK